MSRPSPQTPPTEPSPVTTTPDFCTHNRLCNCSHTVSHAAWKRQYAGEHYMTLPPTIVLLALWSVAMVRFGRSILFPPASLAVVWTVTLLAIWLCGGIYYPLTTTASQVVLAGVFAFSLGAFARWRRPSGGGSPRRRLSAPAYTGRPLADGHRHPSLAEYSLLLSLLQTTERDHRATGKSVEADPHRRQQGKRVRPGNSFDRIHHSPLPHHHCADCRL